MAGMDAGFRAHLESGLTTLARCWALTRKDGVTFGFTDHDCGLSFDGIDFKADTGLSARAVQQSTGLSVDNTEALGALSDAAVTEADIEAGRFDDAELRAWLVNWADVELRWLQFRGSIGEIRRAGGAFTAELRGLTAALNRPMGRVYQKPCTAVLGDARCRFDVTGQAFATEQDVVGIEDARFFRWESLEGFAPNWFTRGRLEVLSGAAQGLWASVKRDEVEAGQRMIETWEPLRAPVVPGDRVRLVAGCDKRLETCRDKFQNILNFQGFPDIPGEDWVMSVPKSTRPNTGGSRR